MFLHEFNKKSKKHKLQNKIHPKICFFTKLIKKVKNTKKHSVLLRPIYCRPTSSVNSSSWNRCMYLEANHWPTLGHLD